MKVVGPLFLPWVREVMRDEEVAVIFAKEFTLRFTDIIKTVILSAHDPKL